MICGRFSLRLSLELALLETLFVKYYANGHPRFLVLLYLAIHKLIIHSPVNHMVSQAKVSLTNEPSSDHRQMKAVGTIREPSRLLGWSLAQLTGFLAYLVLIAVLRKKTPKNHRSLYFLQPKESIFFFCGFYVVLLCRRHQLMASLQHFILFRLKHFHRFHTLISILSSMDIISVGSHNTLVPYFIAAINGPLFHPSSI